ncbi:MAG: GxxExxY protein [Ignavibacteriae bacterium]|nr:GxxExxY protein [Ignavibacteriota bacterium]
MVLKEQELLYKDEVYAIAGAAIEVHKCLGSGFLEAVYHEALEIELAQRRIPFVSEKVITIFYKQQQLKKEYIADFVCYEKIIVEIKSISVLTEKEEAQILNYLKATGMRVGLLINFGSTGRLEWKRFIY